MRICRTVGTGALRNLDPFLMLDELKMPSEEVRVAACSAFFVHHDLCWNPLPHAELKTPSDLGRWP